MLSFTKVSLIYFDILYIMRQNILRKNFNYLNMLINSSYVELHIHMISHPKIEKSIKYNNEVE